MSVARRSGATVASTPIGGVARVVGEIATRNEPTQKPSRKNGDGEMRQPSTVRGLATTKEKPPSVSV